jgi:hypothetical protein
LRATRCQVMHRAFVSDVLQISPGICLRGDAPAIRNPFSNAARSTARCELCLCCADDVRTNSNWSHRVGLSVFSTLHTMRHQCWYSRVILPAVIRFRVINIGNIFLKRHSTRLKCVLSTLCMILFLADFSSHPPSSFSSNLQVLEPLKIIWHDELARHRVQIVHAVLPTRGIIVPVSQGNQTLGRETSKY